MKSLIRILALFFIGSVFYIALQKPRFWWNDEWAGVCFTRGYYRSWSLRFSDGRTIIDGKWQPVTITNGKMRKGKYRWPKFNHTNLKHLRVHELNPALQADISSATNNAK